MNKTITFSILLFFTFFSMNAQGYVEVFVGSSYAEQTYYTLSNDDVSSLDNESWDLAFVTTTADAGILYNESAKTSFSGPVPIMRMYLAPTNNFDDTFNASDLTDSLYNTEASWEDGAFNSVKDINNPFDFGWGEYNPGTHIVNGTKVYALKLRNDTWKKIEVETMENGVYTFKHANLDGSNETTVTIDKADFSDSPLAYFSFDSGETTASPANWDLLFGRYLSPQDNGEEFIEYPITGVLSAPGIEVAEARDIDPSNIDYQPYLDSMSTRIDVVGSDWKFFDLDEFEWVLDYGRAFFIKLADDHLWQINFVDFTGSSTGSMTFQKFDLGVVSAVKKPQSNFIDYGVFPNPIVNRFNVSFSLKQQRSNLQIYLVNSLGQRVWKEEINGNAGLNVLNFNAPKIPTGIYHLVVGQEGDIWTSNVLFK